MTKDKLVQRGFKEAFKEAHEEYNLKLQKEAKRMTLLTLEAIECKKSEKAKLEEELRVLKLDLDDLKFGQIDKIKERQKKSDMANNVSVVKFDWSLLALSPKFVYTGWVNDTYTTSSGNNYYIYS